MYEAVADPYCYPGTSVLKNLPDLRTQEALDAFEAAATMQRADEPLPGGRFTVSHYRAVHRHLFQDVYAWAGAFRTVRLAKDASAFCYPEHISREIQTVFANLRAQNFLRGLDAGLFAQEAAAFLATLNAIHPFREGNGRTQLLFLTLQADHAGHPFNLDRLEPGPFLDAMIRSFAGSTEPLARELRSFLAA